MENSLTTKRSPIVPLRTFFAIECIALVVYFIAANFDAYKYEAYSFLPISRILSYEAFKFPFLSFVQFIITVYVFLSWYYESYTIRPGSIIHGWGVFFKKKKVTPLDNLITVTVASGPIGKLFHYGTIVVSNNAAHRTATLSDISRPSEILQAIERRMEKTQKYEKPDIGGLIKTDEHERLEFKSSLRFDHAISQVNKELEKAAMKTVAAFLNSNGGYLVIGVADTKKPLGLHDDYETLRRKNSDGFENHFTQLFNTMIGPEFRHLIKLWFHTAEEKEICVVSVAPSNRPTYLTLDNKEQFFIRTGNATTPLTLSKAEAYARSRWQEA